MKVCPNCQKQLPDEAAFCDACGLQMNESCLCPQCGHQTAKAFPYCQHCGAPLMVIPAAAPVVTAAPKKRSKKWLWIVLIILLVAALAVGALFLFGGKAEKTTAVYVKDGQLFAMNSAKGEGVQVTSKLADEDDFDDMDMASIALNAKCCVTSDGKYLFYPDKLEGAREESFSLYCRRLDKSKEAPVKIASDVEEMRLSEDGEVLTYKTDDALYQYFVKDERKEKVTNEYYAIIFSTDRKTVYYTDDEEEARLYRKTAGKDKVKIDSDVTDVCFVSDDGETIYYQKEDTLYKKTGDNEREKVVSDVVSVEAVYESGEVFFFKQESDLTLYDFINDDLKSSDAQMKKVDSPTCPYSWNYASNAAYKTAYAKYEKQMAAYDAYEKKVDRDELRKSLKEKSMGFGEFYYFDGSKETKVAENCWIYNGFAASKAPVAYGEYVDVDSVKKVKLSTLSGYSDADDAIRAACNNVLACYLVAKSTVSELEYSDDMRLCVFADDGSRMYFLDDVSKKTQEGDLCYIEITDGKAGKAVTYDKDVYSYRLCDGALYYLKDYNTKTNCCELYVDKVKVDTDVYTSSDVYGFVLKNSMVLYYTDVNDKKRIGTLKLFKDGETTKIADDVTLPLAGVDGDGTVLYLTDYSQKKYVGDLYRWRNGKTEKIEEDVAEVCLPSDGFLYSNYF